MFTIELKGKPSRRVSVVMDDEERSEFGDILAAATEDLEAAGGVEFVVSGFGQERWPLDVAFDLLHCLWGIEQVVDSIARGEPAVLGFWEQGRARDIAFEPIGDQLRVECRSGEDDWAPDPSGGIMDRAAVLAQLRRLVVQFVELVDAPVPELIAWRDRVAGIRS